MLIYMTELKKNLDILSKFSATSAVCAARLGKTTILVWRSILLNPGKTEVLPVLPPTA